MSEIEFYNSFIAEYASFGYARLFARCGDFYQAQGLLERALIEGYSSWEMRRKLFKSGIEIMAHLTDTVAEGEVRPFPGPESHSSFSRSQKLQALGDVIRIVRSFASEEQIALVLLYVEEVKEDKVLRWLEKDAAFIDGLKSDLNAHLSEWNPPTAPGEDARAFFLRSLRQYRLSAQFGSSILNRVRVTTRLPGTLPWVVAGVLLFGIPGVLMLLNIADRWSRMSRYRESEDEVLSFMRFASGSTSDHLIDALFLLTAILLRRYLKHHAPLTLSRGPLRMTMPLLTLSIMGGFAFIGFGFLSAVNPSAFLQGADWRIFGIVRLGWLIGTLALIQCVIYSVIVHYLKRIDDATGIRMNGDSR